MGKDDDTQLIYAYKKAFLTEHGKLVLRDLAASGYFDRNTFTSDPYVTAFNEGKRSVVLDIFAKLHQNVEEYLLQDIVEEDF